VVVLPEPFANTPHRSHFDAPIHRISAQNGKDVASVAPRRLVGPAIVIDRSEACAADPGYLLTVADLEAFEAEHGRIPEGAWVLFRSGWDARAQDEERFLNVGPDGPVTPGPDVDAARWLGTERGISGFGVETVGIDAGAAGTFDPIYPVHQYLLGNDRYGLTQLANLGQLPPTGAVIVVAPLKLVGGTGSPSRVLALVPA
jgi:kynurenine formamidase